MAQKLTASMPEGLDLDASYTIEFAALDPTTGDPVSGVTVSDAYLTVTPVDVDDIGLLQSGPFMLVPGPES